MTYADNTRSRFSEHWISRSQDNLNERITNATDPRNAFKFSHYCRTHCSQLTSSQYFPTLYMAEIPGESLRAAQLSSRRMCDPVKALSNKGNRKTPFVTDNVSRESKWCQNTGGPLLSGHPQDFENWPLNRGWPFNRGIKNCSLETLK